MQGIRYRSTFRGHSHHFKSSKPTNPVLSPHLKEGWPRWISGLPVRTETVSKCKNYLTKLLDLKIWVSSLHHTATAACHSHQSHNWWSVQFSDPITGTYPHYCPVQDWQPSANCSVRPDATKAFDGTWHDSTYYSSDTPQTVTVMFSGMLYFSKDLICLTLVLCSVRLLHNPAHSECFLTTTTYLSFTFDNELSGWCWILLAA